MPIKDSEFEYPVDHIIITIGQRPDIGYLQGGERTCQLTPWNTVKLDRENILLVEDQGIFAGGDLILGPATVTEAIGHGKLAAQVISRMLEGEKLEDIEEDIIKQKEADVKLKPDQIFSEKELKSFKKNRRIQENRLKTAKRIKNFKEVILPINEKQAKDEAGRCLDCGICSECHECAKACEANCFDYDQKEEMLTLDVGGIVVATGSDVFNTDSYGEYGGGELADVITSLEYERLMCASGPTQGHIMRPSDNQEPMGKSAPS